MWCVPQPQPPPETLSQTHQQPLRDSCLQGWARCVCGGGGGGSSVASPQVSRYWAGTLILVLPASPRSSASLRGQPMCPPRLAGWWDLVPRMQAPFGDPSPQGAWTPCQSQARRTPSLTCPCRQRAFPGPGVSAALSRRWGWGAAPVRLLGPVRPPRCPGQGALLA